MPNTILKSWFVFTFTVVLVVATSRVATSQTAPSSAPSSAAKDRASEVKLFSKDEVSSSFQKGGTLLQGANYRIMTSMRQEPGQVEVHTKFTDVFYILEGNATIVVGGQMIGQKSTDPDEPRGTTIEGGETHQLSAGEVVVIPAGIPHWMNKIEPPFRYFVVKVQASGE